MWGHSAHIICEHLSHVSETWWQEEQVWSVVILQDEPKEEPAKEMEKNQECRVSTKSRNKALQAGVVCLVKAADRLRMKMVWEVANGSDKIGAFILDKSHIRGIQSPASSGPAFLSQLPLPPQRALGFSYLKVPVMSGYATSIHHGELLFVLTDGDEMPSWSTKPSLRSQRGNLFLLRYRSSHYHPPCSFTLRPSHLLGFSHRGLLLFL